ncbi:MAG TPA: hypothetical protein VHD33_08155, partial [Legionellaceae bacterium]|nr:hypothetical protein [Legionellaceae bacterium]
MPVNILLALWLLCQTALSFAFSVPDFPYHFLLKTYEDNQTIDLLLQDNQKVGFLQPKAPHHHTNGIYFFYDQNGQRKLIIKCTHIYRSSFEETKFDVFDNAWKLVAKLYYRISENGSKMIIHHNDQTLLTIVRNNLGPTYSVYQGNTWTVVATLHRKFFTWSLDMTVEINNKDRLLSIVDPNIFAASVALLIQCRRGD